MPIILQLSEEIEQENEGDTFCGILTDVENNQIYMEKTSRLYDEDGKWIELGDNFIRLDPSREDPKAFAEYKANKEKAISSLVDTYNDTWNKMAEDPNAVFDQKKFKFLVQKQAAEGMLESAFESDQFGFIDSKDIAKFNQIYDVISNGGARFFEQQLNDYANLDDASLAQAFPTDKQQIKSGKLRKRFTDMIDSIGVMEENYNKLSDKYENPCINETKSKRSIKAKKNKKKR